MATKQASKKFTPRRLATVGDCKRTMADVQAMLDGLCNAILTGRDDRLLRCRLSALAYRLYQQTTDVALAMPPIGR